MADVKTKQRGGVRATLTAEMNKISASLQDPSAGYDVVKLKTTLKRLQHNLERVYKLDDEVQTLLSGAELDDDITKAEAYNDRVLTYISTIEEMLSRSETAANRQASANVQNAVQTTKATIKLPKFEMSTFSGNPLEWQHFWDLFRTAVHNNPDISAVEKFTYLIGYLEDDALAVARGYDITEDNYNQVVEALKERFGDRQRAQFAHFQALIAIEPAKSMCYAEIQGVYDKCEIHIRSLIALELEETTFAVVFVPIILSKLPAQLAAKLYEKNGGAQWSLKDLREWIKADLRAREMGKAIAGAKPVPPKKTEQRPPTSSSSLPAPDARMHGQFRNSGFARGRAGTPRPQQFVTPCIYCGKTNHRHSDCRTIPTTEARMKTLQQQGSKLCRICFRSTGHRREECPCKTRPCVFCKKPGHHPSLCYEKYGPPAQRQTEDQSKSAADQPTNTQQQGTKDPNQTPKKTAATVTVSHLNSTESDVAFLKTAVVVVENENSGKSSTARCLMDDASSRSYITEALCRKLNLKIVGSTYISIGRFGTNKRKTRETQKTRFSIVCKDGSIQPVLASITPVISCPIARHPIDQIRYPVVKTLDLAEPLNPKPDNLEIDILIGSDQYYNFVSSKGTITRDPGLVLVPSRLGYLTAGTMPISKNADGDPESSLVLLSVDNPLSEEMWSDSYDLERFWQIEDVGTKSKQVTYNDDAEALQQFEQTVQFHDQRYHVTWPWKVKNPDLPNNFGLAYGRLKSALTRLKTDERLLLEYDNIIRSQAKNGIIESAPNKPDGLVYFLPHHPVIQPDRSTTKVRIVYDASAKTGKDALSLNDCLLRGFVILEDLCGLLMRFRLHKVALISDIEKAFLQLRLQRHERDVSRFLWVKDPMKPPTGDNLVIWRFTSVFFGAISSPFLLAATVKTHLRRSDGKVAEKILGNLYVDNVVTGEETTENAIEHYHEAKQLFSELSMNLREFYTNSETVRQAINPNDQGKSSDPKVLGIKWNTETDTLRCTDFKPGDKLITKRLMARQVAQVYDPCGWFSPVVVTGKLIIQEAWKRDLAWDEKVPSDIEEPWKRAVDELSKISSVNIPRYIGAVGEIHGDLHVFCDASNQATAASVYLRKATGNEVTSDLIFAKSRIAPLKPVQTIPRLELVAVEMGTNLIEFVERQLRIPIDNKTVWSDSQCVLYWITKEKLETGFVKRRILNIRKKKNLTFRYVTSADNPADLPSRGCTMDTLQDSGKWWHGPDWLIQDREDWPKDRTVRLLEKEPTADMTQLVILEKIDEEKASILNPEKYSSFRRLIRVTAYVQRFGKNLRTRASERSLGPLDKQELSRSRIYWEKVAQKEGFPTLKSTLTIKVLKDAGVFQLNLFRDEADILRCGGRLSNAVLEYETQHPVLLPKRHPITKLIIREAHLDSGHAGLAQTIHTLRQRYWLPRSRNATKEILRICRRCRRIEGGPFKIPNQPPLPEFRVKRQAPFATTGLDYLGFLTVKIPPNSSQKVWVCLFTCASTRAVHLELVEDQSAQEFHLALRRFFSIYGFPELIVSDNASQFITVESALKKLWTKIIDSDELADTLAGKNIEWKKLPQLSPWMGGFFERLVGIVKKFLKKSLDGVLGTMSQMRTILAEITAIINSRPLLYIDDDVNSRQLSPADLLGQFDKRYPPTFREDKPDEPPMRGTVGDIVSQWKRLQAVTNSFWNEWREGYLTQLREKHANASQRNPSLLQPTIGSIVQIKDNLPRAQWRLGKIEKLHRSGDGEIRSVTLRLSNGRGTIRPIKLLYPLEMQVENASGRVEVDVSPFTVRPDSNEIQSSDENFFGFDSQDIEQTVEKINKLDKFIESIEKTDSRNKSAKNRPQRRTAVEARAKIQNILDEKQSRGEGSDEVVVLATEFLELSTTASYPNVDHDIRYECKSSGYNANDSICFDDLFQYHQTMDGPHVVDVVQGHPLSMRKTYINVSRIGFQFPDVPVNSLEMALGYTRLRVAGKHRECEELVTDPHFLWQPQNGGLERFVERALRDSKSCIQFKLRLDRVLQAIIEEQFKDPSNHIRVQMEYEIAKADGRDIIFHVYGNDPVLTLGHNPSGKKPDLIGFNVLGECLMNVSRKWQRGEPLTYELSSLMNPEAYESSFTQSALVIMDSQGRYLRATNRDAEVVAVSGANYGDVINVLRSDVYNLETFGLIAIYCGTNCFHPVYIESGQRDRDWLNLVELLKRVAQTRPANSVLYCPAFHHPYIWPENDQFVEYAEVCFRGSGVLCLNWNRIKNPFTDHHDMICPRYFEDEVPGHLTPRASTLLYRHFQLTMPKLRFVQCSAGDERVTVSKSAFEAASTSEIQRRSRSPVIDQKARVSQLSIGRSGNRQSPTYSRNDLRHSFRDRKERNDRDREKGRGDRFEQSKKRRGESGHRDRVADERSNYGSSRPRSSSRRSESRSGRPSTTSRSKSGSNRPQTASKAESRSRSDRPQTDHRPTVEMRVIDEASASSCTCSYNSLCSSDSDSSSSVESNRRIDDKTKEAKRSKFERSRN